MEAQLSAALQSSENKSKTSSDSTEGMESAAVTKKLEEELLKRDALIEVYYFNGQDNTTEVKE